MAISPDAIAHLIQSSVKDCEARAADLAASINELHRLLNTAAKRSAGGETLTAGSLASMGFGATATSLVAAASTTSSDDGPNGAGSGKSQP